jgi:malic enzyme
MPMACVVHADPLLLCCHGRLLGTERMDSLTPEQQIFARAEDGGLPLKDIVQKYKPTMLLGVTAVGGIFTEHIIRSMASSVDRPIIFPLSNPTSRAECTAEQAYEWTKGRCIFASGSPFDPVQLDDGRIFYPSQCNNSKSACLIEIYLQLD